jgi:hypothetical protein
MTRAENRGAIPVFLLVSSAYLALVLAPSAHADTIGVLRSNDLLVIGGFVLNVILVAVWLTVGRRSRTPQRQEVSS